ncbi:MAG: hypothetical protein AAGA76_15305 [Pseudomonadota bacterium]
MFDYIHIYAVVFTLAAIFVAVNANRVPNLLLLLLAMLFPAAMFFSGGTLAGMIPHLIAGVIAFVLAIVGFMLIGSGGFWKTLAVIALWTPTSMLLTTFVAIFVIPILIIAAARVVSTSVSQRVADF